MCGLTGMFDSLGGGAIDADLLRTMTDRLRHRGPDGSGYHVGPGIGLGHRRLAVIDPVAGAQPMTNENGRIQVVFNGEIYNFRELAAELERAGHRFRSHCDTEVIVHGWEEWGADAVLRFQGMFAFALWDEDRQTLMLARDHLGKKPLYWTRRADGLLLFASELKALRCCPGLALRLDAQAVDEYFAFGYVPEPRSIYAGIHKLPAAHRLIWRRGAPEGRLESYWDVAFADRPADAEALAEALRRATRARLVADVPLGAFLSGGLDSSAVVAMMAEGAERPVQTFAIGFSEPDYDESVHAERVARRFGTSHHARRLDPDDVGLVARLADIYDEPFGDASAIPTFRLCQLARQRVTVALSGDGGDEVFAGYRRYVMHLRTERLRRMMPAALRRPLFATLARITPKADWAPRWLRAKTTFVELAGTSAEAYFQAVSALGEEARRTLFAESFRRRLQGHRAVDLIDQHLRRAASDRPLQQIQYVDLKTWLPGDILVKVDRASMANSLEVRAPFLDVGLVEWGLGLPDGAKIRHGSGKWLLKRAMESRLDHDLIQRRKQGFAVPLRRWFRGPLRPLALGLADSERLADCGVFDMAAIRRLADQHARGIADHAVGLWLLLMFDGFLAGHTDISLD